jgi:alpha-amylase
MKVFFDCVINHTGNNWSYQEGDECWYDPKKKYHLGEWRRPDIPIPFELRNPNYYQKKGMIRNWDKYPETIEGDFFSLKKLDHTESLDGQRVQEILYQIYAFWIKETDCDGFRMDAAKHIGEKPLRNFVSQIKSYAKSLGKLHFFVFAEIPGDDKLLQKFMSPFPSQEGENLQSIDSALDFQLHFKLPKVVSEKANDKILFDRYSSIKKNLEPHFGRPVHLITFLDNHDQIESPLKERIAFRLGPQKTLNALQLLFTLPGIPCLYYGTEQGLQGHGESDDYIREMMFDPYSDLSIMDQNSFLYKEIQSLVALRGRYPGLIYGELGKVHISQGVGVGEGSSVIGYSRKWKGEELIILCNLSDNETRLISVKKDKRNNQQTNDEKLILLYGGEGTIHPTVIQKNYSLFQLKIPPSQILILN